MLVQANPSDPRRHSRSGYARPENPQEIGILEVTAATGRPFRDPKQIDLLRTDKAGGSDAPLFYAGDLSLLEMRCVSIVGTRNASPDGRKRAAQLAKRIVRAGMVVVSGLARGIDTCALRTALDEGGSTVAVIGTPIDRVYPAENAGMQEDIWRRHLLLSPFPSGSQVFPSNFPKRNRVMAAISDATVIIEASDTSGTRHQAAECTRLGRPLFLARSLVENNSITWVRGFLGKPGVHVLDSFDALWDVLSTRAT